MLYFSHLELIMIFCLHFSVTRNPCSPNPCLGNSICLITYQGKSITFICKCPHLYKLTPDGRSCESKQSNDCFFWPWPSTLQPPVTRILLYNCGSVTFTSDFDPKHTASIFTHYRGLVGLRDTRDLIPIICAFHIDLWPLHLVTLSNLNCFILFSADNNFLLFSKKQEIRGVDLQNATYNVIPALTVPFVYQVGLQS